MPRSNTKTAAYDPQDGSLYAQTYALYSDIPEEKRIFFYDADGNDCSNFVSQCIWAAYGGWMPGTDVLTAEQNRQRVRENIRQVPKVWHGSATHSGTPNWCRVEGLYAYLVSSKTSGPLGEQVAEGTWDSVEPSVIRQGDIIQMVVSGYADYRYGHSLYVTRSGPTFGDILICCHSYDRLNAPLSTFSLSPDAYPKLRILRLRDADFVR